MVLGSGCSFESQRLHRTYPHGVNRGIESSGDSRQQMPRTMTSISDDKRLYRSVDIAVKCGDELEREEEEPCQGSVTRRRHQAAETKADSPKIIDGDLTIGESVHPKDSDLANPREDTDMIMVFATPRPPSSRPQPPTAQAVALRILELRVSFG